MLATRDFYPRVFAVFLSLLSVFSFVFANSEIAELKQKINSSQTEIEKLEEEIKKYEAELHKISKEKRTLKNALAEIEYSRKKLINQIYITEKQIQKLKAEIAELEQKSKNKEEKIKVNKSALASFLRRLNELEETTFAEIILSKNFNQILVSLESLRKLQDKIQEKNAKLRKEKIDLNKSKEELVQKKKELASKKRELSSKKISLDIARSEQKKLISKTSNKEANYQKIIAKKKQAKKEFEAQLREFESKLKYALDPDKLPSPGDKILSPPLSKVYITQYFGNTRFARSGAYNGKGHNGIDLRASIGTPVKATLSGIVQDLGNTDKYKGCYSYGKWVLIKHGNGLSSLYAHLSKISVRKGQRVSTGQIIAYSGNTGYSTGPHLHFTLYASDAVRVLRLGEIKKRTNCAKARVPVAPLKAYLNPLDYLNI